MHAKLLSLVDLDTGLSPISLTYIVFKLQLLLPMVEKVLSYATSLLWVVKIYESKLQKEVLVSFKVKNTTSKFIALACNEQSSYLVTVIPIWRLITFWQDPRK